MEPSSVVICRGHDLSELFEFKEVLGGLVVLISFLVNFELGRLPQVQNVALIIQESTLLIPKYGLRAFFLRLGWGHLDWRLGLGYNGCRGGFVVDRCYSVEFKSGTLQGSGVSEHI